MADLTLFGYTLTRKKPEEKKQSFIPPLNDDGATSINASGFFGTYLDIDTVAKSENDLISRYRDVASYPDCDSAIEDIVNESVAAQDDEAIVKLDLEKVDLSKNVKKLMEEEFDNILNLLDFNSKSHDIFKRWYIDGRSYYHKIVDTGAPKKGIQELRYIDPRKIKKVRKVNKEKDVKSGVEFIKSIEEFFVYNEKGLMATVPSTATAAQGIRIAPDSITYCTSGLLDLDRNMVLSHLHKAIKIVNQLRMTEDALVIYRMSRAPERRIFYIDVGNLPTGKAEQYVKNIMDRYRNKTTYDATTGEMRDEKRTLNMLEDFWMPRREGGKGTEITTLQGGQNLGNIEDVEYFQNKLYQALNVPVGRMRPDNNMNFGRQSEITRDEIKFSKFISRLRKKFTEIFDDLLKTQLLLKNIMSEEDWNRIREDIYYQFSQDVYFAEAKESEILRNRIELLNAIQPYVGSYFSREYVFNNVLRLNEEEIEKMQQEIDADPKLQQMLQDQQGQDQQGQSLTQPGAPQGSAPTPYDPNNPVVEDTINNVRVLRGA